MGVYDEDIVGWIGGFFRASAVVVRSRRVVGGVPTLLFGRRDGAHDEPCLRNETIGLQDGEILTIDLHRNGPRGR